MSDPQSKGKTDRVKAFRASVDVYDFKADGQRRDGKLLEEPGLLSVADLETDETLVLSMESGTGVTIRKPSADSTYVDVVFSRFDVPTGGWHRQRRQIEIDSMPPVSQLGKVQEAVLFFAPPNIKVTGARRTEAFSRLTRALSPVVAPTAVGASRSRAADNSAEARVVVSTLSLGQHALGYEFTGEGTVDLKAIGMAAKKDPRGIDRLKHVGLRFGDHCYWTELNVSGQPMKIGYPRETTEQEHRDHPLWLNLVAAQADVVGQADVLTLGQSLELILESGERVVTAPLDAVLLEPAGSNTSNIRPYGGVPVAEMDVSNIHYDAMSPVWPGSPKRPSDVMETYRAEVVAKRVAAEVVKQVDGIA